MHDLADSQRGAIGDVHQSAIAMVVVAHAGYDAHAVGAVILAGEHTVHTGRSLRRRRVDGQDFCVRVG